MIGGEAAGCITMMWQSANLHEIMVAQTAPRGHCQGDYFCRCKDFMPILWLHHHLLHIVETMKLLCLLLSNNNKCGQ